MSVEVKTDNEQLQQRKIDSIKTEIGYGSFGISVKHLAERYGQNELDKISRLPANVSYAKQADHKNATRERLREKLLTKQSKK